MKFMDRQKNFLRLRWLGFISTKILDFTVEILLLWNYIILLWDKCSANIGFYNYTEWYLRLLKWFPTGWKFEIYDYNERYLLLQFCKLVRRSYFTLEVKFYSCGSMFYDCGLCFTIVDQEWLSWPLPDALKITIVGDSELFTNILHLRDGFYGCGWEFYVCGLVALNRYLARCALNSGVIYIYIERVLSTCVCSYIHLQ